MKKIRISPSILSADFLNLYDSIKEIENAGADEIHYDVMDGMFVPNITFGLPILDSIRVITNLKIDVHMMVEEPVRFINEFERSGADIFTIHYEACENIEDSIKKIKNSRMEIGISIKPNTNVKSILPYLESVDRILIMTVEPGFGGQAFNENMVSKISTIKNYLIEKNIDIDIAVDGGIKVENSKKVIDAGANVLISGTGIFQYDKGAKSAISELRNSDKQ
tara:strand:- start:12831 stop:13496 length:666 start_codon:yes stop_codon:yes gene_type:complete